MRYDHTVSLGPETLGPRFPDSEGMMRCSLCRHGATRPGKVTVTLQRGETTVVLKGVPAEVCENCDEYYLSESISAQVTERAEDAVLKGVEIEVLRFAA